MADPTPFPEQGRPVDDLVAEMAASRDADADWRGGSAAHPAFAKAARPQGGLHLMFWPAHVAVADELLADLAEAVATHGPSRGVEATYGGVAD